MRPQDSARVTARAALVLAALIVQGCTDPTARAMKAYRVQHPHTAAKVEALGQALDADELLNASLVRQYAKVVRSNRPSLEAIATTLEREATSEGRAYRHLAERLGTLPGPETVTPAGVEQALEEAVRVSIAADKEVFNDALIDPLNVLADLSRGVLPRMGGAEGEGGGEGQDPAGRLVGNPAYGQWTESGTQGGARWSWLESYLLVSALSRASDGYRYDDWYRSRGWSYHSDVGAGHYGTGETRTRAAQAAKRHPDLPRKQWRPLGSERRLSTYSQAAQAGGSIRGGRRSSWFKGK